MISPGGCILRTMLRRVGLFAGDVLTLIGMVGVGLASHGYPLTLERVLEVCTPFVLSWVLVVWIIGFQRTSTRLSGILRAWVVAFPLGLSLRLLMGDEVPLLFALVTFVSYGLAMVVWRAVVARILCRLG